MHRFITASIGIVAVCATAIAFADPREHFTVTSTSPRTMLPHKVLLLPLDISVYRVGAGGVTERAEDLTKDERTETETMLRDEIAKDKHLEFVAFPTLDSGTQALLDEYIELYDQVAGAALLHTSRLGAWPQKVNHFDYTLGDGLRFLRQRSGADAALIIHGEGGVPTTSSFVAGLIPIIVGVVAVPQARAQAVVGIVDLQTGNLLWLNHAMLPGGVGNAVSRALGEYPDAVTSSSAK